MSKYIDILGSVVPTVAGAQRAANVTTALAPPAAKDAPKGGPAASPPGASLTSRVKDMAPGLVGAGAGAYAWKKHRVLGALAGHAVASNAMGVYHGGEERKRALCNMAVEGAGVGGAYYYKKHPIVGYALGLVAGAVATSFVKGSPSSEMVAKFKK